jgi:glycosyltransferase involved in cell wall biosynthesis
MTKDPLSGHRKIHSVKAATGTCRLLYVVGQLGLGGLERQLSYLLRMIDKARYRPALIVWNSSPDDIYAGEIRALGIPIHCFPRTATSVAKLHGVRRLARQWAPEVIHSYSFFTNFAVQWAAFGSQAVAVGSLRGDFVKDKKDSGLWKGCLSARWPRYQISNSVSSADIARRFGGVFAPKRIDIVRNGLDLERFRSHNGRGGSPTYIAAVGSLLPVKRWDRVLKIVAHIKSRKVDCRVRIAGEGPLRHWLERLAQDLDITDSVEFIGTTLDIPAFLEESRFVVHTSDSEGCPNAVMEAMACARAVVAMDAGDIPFLVEDGRSGFVVRQGDETTFAARVVQLLSDSDLCHRMGLAARTKVEQQFGLGRLVSETLGAYQAAGWKG